MSNYSSHFVQQQQATHRRKVTMTQSTDGKPQNWKELSPEQKRDWRLERWMQSAENIKFVSKEAGEGYRARIKRLTRVYKVEEPDRVPVFIRPGMLPFYDNGMDYHEAVYNPHKAVQACIKYNLEHLDDYDGFHMASILPGQAFEILDYGLYAWPGHGVSETNTCFQFVEKEYMKADEYDALIRDPSDFWLRKYMPRIFRELSPMERLGPLTDLVEIPIRQLLPLGTDDVQNMLRKLLAAGQEMKKFQDASKEFNHAAEANGYPSAQMDFAKAPFDTIGDTLRGTGAVMKDIYRNPDKLLAALDIMADLTIKSVLESPRNVNSLIGSFPLHKGADGWMSQKHFETFYWPSLKKIMNAMIDEGMIVSLFAEGSYNSRLETINEFPRGFVHWHFDQTDMARAKKILGNKCSIAGNVSASSLIMGNAGEIKTYCKELIEMCGPGGGFILAPGAQPEFPRLENAKAMTEAVHEYGQYPLGR
jgi:hypothetical protein